MDKRITDFLKKHHVLTIATTIDNIPWCANCFYVFLEEETSFVFTADDDTRHGYEFAMNPVIAGSVVLETRLVGKIQGVQFTGKAFRPDEMFLRRARDRYLKRFPISAFMDTSLWIVKVDHIKMTDNRLGFGKKLVWNKD